jgi:hypothetical protein
VIASATTRAHCWACEIPTWPDRQELHHVIPAVLGGDKLVRLCTPCHDWIDRAHPEDRERFFHVAVRFLLAEHDPIPDEDVLAFRMVPREVRLFFLLLTKWMAYCTAEHGRARRRQRNRRDAERRETAHNEAPGDVGSVPGRPDEETEHVERQ